ncbi:MAG: DUF362 domain-containing protein [Polyangiaceae bacterium]
MNESRTPPPEVTVHRTSPSALTGDVDRLFEACAAPALDRHRPVWIKVNGNFNIAYPGSNTSPWFLRALLASLRDRGYRDVTVVEGDLPEFRAEDMARSTGLAALLEKFGVPFVSYERMPRDEFELPRALADVQLLNTPVFHTHGHATISCATKNLFGLLPVTRRRYHTILSDKLLELAALVPCVTLVDGTVGLEGESTRRGDPVRCDLLVGGRDPVAIDVVAARLMGFDPESVPLLRMALDVGRVTLDVPVRGDFEAKALPAQRFVLTLGRIRKTVHWLTDHGVDVDPLLALTDGLRATWHRVNYRQKKRKLAEGPWREYESAGA